MLQQQNSVAKSNSFTKILQYTWSDLSPQRLSPSVFWPLQYNMSLLSNFVCNVGCWSSNIGANCCPVLIYHCRSKKRNISSQKKRYFSHAYLNIEKEHYFCGKVLSTKNLLLGSPQGSRTRNFPWLVWACPPGYFHRKHRGTKTKRILQLFKS